MNHISLAHCVTTTADSWCPEGRLLNEDDEGLPIRYAPNRSRKKALRGNQWVLSEQLEAS